MIRNAFIFDLDGTLVDSVYQHVLAWHEALHSEGIELSVWQIHRKIGMSGGLFVNQLFRALDRSIDPDCLQRLRERHDAAYHRLAVDIAPLPGAVDLLQSLSESQIPWAIATSGRIATAGINLEAIGVDLKRDIVVTRDQVRFAKPDPDLFIEASRRLEVPIEHAIVVGDSVWDMLAAARCGALGIGLLSGGYGRDELERARALRVYDNPAHLLRHLDEVSSREHGLRATPDKD